MKHPLKELLALPKSLFGAALVLVASAAVTTAPATAQKRVGVSVGGNGSIEVVASKETRRGGATLRIGDRGVSLDAYRGGDLASQRGRHRIPRGESGGRYETRFEQYWVPGYDKRVWVAPTYEWRYDSCGRRFRVETCAGYYRTVCIPGRYETRSVRVWVPARRVIDVRRDQRGQRGRDYGRDRSRSRTHRVTYRN